jgi:hypothetical protein
MLRSIAARKERMLCRLIALRCVSKHEGCSVAILILRDARTRVRVCGTSSACALLRMRTSIAYGTVHYLKQPISFPRRISAPGFCDFASLTPNRGGGRSAEKRSGACEAPVGRIMTRYARRLTRRLASHNAGRSPLGAPPWRFFTRGRASVSGITSGSVQRAPRSQVIVPGGRLPGPPGASGGEPPPQDATPRSAFRIVSRRRPSMSEAGKLSSTDTLRSQVS